MINVLNLLWICPLCVVVGFFLAALMVASGDASNFKMVEECEPSDIEC